jgi:hypothetical protein
MLTVTQGVRTRRLATRETGILNGLPKQLHELADYSLPPLKDWEFPVDNLFAEHVFTAVGSETLLPAPEARQPGGSLCSRCIHLDFWVGGFSMIDDVTAIAAQKGLRLLCVVGKSLQEESIRHWWEIPD